MSQNVVNLSDHPAHVPGATCRVAPIEAKWVREADEAAARTAARFHAGATRIRATIEAADHALGEMLERYTSAHRAHLTLGLQGFRPIVPEWVYWMLLVLAAVLEAPVNNSALSFLGMDGPGTWSVAGFLSILNVLAASQFGKRLRQLNWGRPRRDWVLLAVLGAVSFALMLSLAVLRSDYIAFDGAREALPTSVATLPTLLLLQALFFTVGTVISFNMVPSDARLSRVLADKRSLRKSIDQQLGQRAALAAAHDRMWYEALHAIQERRSYCMALVAEYRDSNMIERRSPPPTWMRRALPGGVFAPLMLGERIGQSSPGLEELLARAEQRAAEPESQALTA